jgi:hypothetical protein
MMKRPFHASPGAAMGTVPPSLYMWLALAVLAGLLLVTVAAGLWRLVAPRCASGRPALDEVTGLLTRGKPELAAALAGIHLSRTPERPLCGEARAALAALWYEASLRGLLTAPRPAVPDAAWAQQLVAEWQAVERQATQYGVPPERRWAPMSVATLAYSAALWPLADAAFRQAWQNGQAGVEGAAFRYALLRNWGRELAGSGSAAGRAEGVRLLATARAIAVAYGLPAGEACHDLEALGYADCTVPLPDPGEPLLQGRPF